MDKALSIPEIVRNILEQIHAGAEDRAQERACAAADAWISASKNLHLPLRDEDEIWATLLSKVFPKAPTLNNVRDQPGGWGHQLPETETPTNHQELFHAMCNRHKQLRLTEEALEKTRAELAEAKREYSKSGAIYRAFMKAHPEFVFHDGARREEPAPDNADERLKAEWGEITKAYRKARRQWFAVGDLAREQEKRARDEKACLQHWAPLPTAIRLHRQQAPARPEWYIRNEADTSDEDGPV